MIKPLQVLTTIQELREAKEMQAKGVKFQSKHKTSVNVWDDGDCSFNIPQSFDYRRAAVEIKPGQVVQPHEFDVAEEMQRNGIKFQFRKKDGSTDWGRRHSMIFFRSSGSEEYRREPESPVKKIVPLGPEDVPPGSIIRSPHRRLPQSWSAVCCLLDNGTGVKTVNGDRLFSWLMRDEHGGVHEIKRPGEDWKPCYKEVEVS